MWWYLANGVGKINSLVQASETTTDLWLNKDPERSSIPNCWTMCKLAETVKVGLEKQQIKKGVSHKASWTLGIWPVPRDQRTFWNLWLKYQSIYDNSQTCIFACKLMTTGLRLGVKSRTPSGTLKSHLLDGCTDRDLPNWDSRLLFQGLPSIVWIWM